MEKKKTLSHLRKREEKKHRLKIEPKSRKKKKSFRLMASKLASMASKRSSMPSRLLSLPEELQHEVIYRTPVEALIQSATLCKRWTALLTNKKVIHTHLDRSAERFIRTVDTVNVVDPVTRRRSSTSPVPREFQDPNNTDALLHCDGLMLCRLRGCHVKRFEPEDPRRPQIAIWNPVLRKVKWIMPSDCVSAYNNFGLGYKNRGDYLILRFPQIQYKFVEGENPVEIYELKNESWRTLEHVKVDWVVDRSCQGVSVLGNMYWVVAPEKKKKRKSYILGFNFTVETFNDVCLCPPPPLSCGGDRYLSCYSKDRLSLLQEDTKSRKIEVWLSNNLADASVSLTKHFSVASPDHLVLKPREFTSYPVYCFVKPKSIVAWCEGAARQGQRFCTYCTLYEIGEDALGNSTETERNCDERRWLPDFCGHVYVPSLVWL